jgi:hypothetical protein
MSKVARLNPRLAAFVTSLLILGGLAVPAWSAHATFRPHLRFGISRTHPDMLVMVWKGEIKAPMSDEISAAFELNKNRIRKVEFKLDSGGGSVKEGEKVIAVLQQIKKTHKLATVVAAGKRCGSMCVFIYVQGQKRLAAPASLWLFHEVSIVNRKTKKISRLDREAWEQLVDKYWVPAGVNPTWIAEVKTHTNQTDYWQSGESLLQDGSNIILQPLPDERRRIVTPTPDAEPSQKAGN